MIAGLYKIFEHWAEKGTVWIISDTHFGDAEVKALNPARPSDEDLVKLINSKVGKHDTLIHLGDVGDIEYAKRLKGYKVLVCGNHDRGVSNYEEVFDEVYAGPVLIGARLLLSHEPIAQDFAMNFHGHVHDRRHKDDKLHKNFCCDGIGSYEPVNLNQLMKKSGIMSGVQSYHRATIDKATERKRKRGK